MIEQGMLTSRHIHIYRSIIHISSFMYEKEQR